MEIQQTQRLQRCTCMQKFSQERHTNIHLTERKVTANDNHLANLHRLAYISEWLHDNQMIQVSIIRIKSYSYGPHRGSQAVARRPAAGLGSP